uniref:Uncharacterized protein n=1 Tax=Lotharella oceanica TaxID=641309 RepID=A0A7S2U552_9EUKA|mmetsp:Transcript_8474/g.16668  ORF Transcript_8474/g.16668 Transcript_8474/m.16668 type:complete len:155 (+) Transcript_8474:172-636(+)
MDATSKLIAILDYNGSLWDCFLNYLMTGLAVALMISFGTAESAMRWTFFFAAITTYQLSLCLFLFECVGISIVWNTVITWMLFHKRNEDKRKDRDRFQSMLMHLSLLLGIVVNMYYFFAEELLTTFAHVLSWGLGIAVYYLDARLSGPKGTKDL